MSDGGRGSLAHEWEETGAPVLAGGDSLWTCSVCRSYYWSAFRPEPWTPGWNVGFQGALTCDEAVAMSVMLS